VLMIMTLFVSSAVPLVSHLIGYFGTWLRRSLFSHKYFMSSARSNLVPDIQVSTNVAPLLPQNRQSAKQLRR
jgi:hypothetical protein